MSIEIELKAHIENQETLKNLLMEKAEYLSAFEKADCYYFLPEPQDRFPSGVRVRREKRTFPDGTEKSTTIVTFKKKEVRDGIEVNNESEFEVAEQSDLEESGFEEFLAIMGLNPGFSKRKIGFAFSHNGINIELLEVEGLGWFVELEIITNIIYDDGIYDDGSSTDKIPKAAFMEERNRLLGFLDSIGVSREAIESRFYSQMLRGL